MVQTVIIVDDNLICARLYKAMLEPLACRVLVARSAEEAARLVRPDRNPSDDEEDERPTLGGVPRPLFLVAALHQAEMAMLLARNTGADALLVRKPIGRDGLATLVRRHLGGRH